MRLKKYTLVLMFILLGLFVLMACSNSENVDTEIPNTEDVNDNNENKEEPAPEPEPEPEEEPEPITL